MTWHGPDSSCAYRGMITETITDSGGKAIAHEQQEDLHLIRLLYAGLLCLTHYNTLVRMSKVT